MASNEDVMPILEELRFARSSDSPTNSNSPRLSFDYNSRVQLLSTPQCLLVHYPPKSILLLSQLQLHHLNPHNLLHQPSPLITTLQPYSPSLCNTTSLNKTLSSARPRPCTTNNPTNILNTLFSPAKCYRFFVNSPTSP